MIEKFLVQYFLENNIGFYHFAPSKVKKPYVIFDLLSGSMNVYQAYDEARYAFDIYGENLGEIVELMSKVRALLEDLDINDSDFASVDIYNVIDNTHNTDIHYTVYVSFLYNKGIYTRSMNNDK